MFAARRITVGSILLVTLAFALLLGLRGLPSAAAEGEAEATIVRELTERRTEYGTTYLLSNGQYRTVISHGPVHYRDAAGDWQPVDTTLVEVSDGVYETAASAVTVTVQDEAAGSPAVTVATATTAVALNLIGAREDGLTVEGSAATYPGVATATDVSYAATGDGLKETITLASGAAPNTFTYRLSHPGLTLALDEETGTWGLYREGREEPTFTLGAINVCDASADEAGEPAWCDGAKMSVTPGEGESTVTYTVPRAWLADPARVWPVTIDPTLTSRAPEDTYISSGHPGTAYGSTDAQNLLCGEISTDMGVCKTLIRFPAVDNHNNIPEDAHVSAATFSIRQYWQPATNHDRLHVYRIYGDSSWGESSTWNSANITGKQEIQPDNLSCDAEQDWIDVTCPGVMQGWVQHKWGASGNQGFMIAQRSDEGSSYARKFRSGNYGDPDWRPNIAVDWEQPTTASAINDATLIVGQSAQVTVTVGSVADATDITGIRMGVNRTSSDASRRRGILAWFASPPTGDAHWVYQKALVAGGGGATDGFIAYYASTDYGSDHIEPLLSACTISADHKTAVFAFKALESWGSLSPSACQMDTRLEMSAGSSGSWTSGWTPQTSPTFSVDTASGMPQALTCLSAQTTATASWFVGTANNDANTSGRGTATLSWPAVPLADSYAVYLWDGVKYDRVDDPTNPVTGTSWTTPATLYPTDSQIASIPQGYTGNPFATYGSKDLRDNPNALYQKMAGASNKDTDYRFKVVPLDAGSGQSPSLADSGELRLTLDNRSVVATGDASKEDPRHVFYDFAEWDGHSVGALLDQRDLTLATCDLAVASWGPEAALTRTYTSAVTTAGKGAPGWFFSFEQSLQITANQITYTDAERLPHVFAGSGSSWTAPNGFFATLAADGANWQLTFFDSGYLTFDAAGKLLAETDANGNTVTYTWTSGNVTSITAANGQYITLTWSSGKLSGASYATAAGTRSVTYATASPWRVTAFPNVTGVERKVLYGYDASSRLTAITQENWPSAGQSAAMAFIYSSGDLTEVRFADYHATTKPDARATLTYDSATQATVRRYGKVGTQANQAMNQEVYIWSGAAAGVSNQLVSLTAGTGGLANTESYGYAFDRQLATTLSSDGGLVSDTVNSSHDFTSSTQTTGSLDAVNEVTTSTCDTLHRVTTETSYQSPTVWALTTNTYAGANVTATQTTDQASALLSASAYAYDPQGRTTQEKQLVSGTVASGVWTQTDYSSFAPCGEPQTTIARSVKLSPTASPQDLTRTASYDAFGNLLSGTDWGGRTSVTSAYDIAGRQLTSTDAAGVVAHMAYDCMGNTVESYLTTSGTQTKADWTETTCDALGGELMVTTKLSDASGNPTTESVATTTYDGSGNELGADDTTLGGQSAKSTFDANANVTEEWAAGVLNYSDAGRSTRSVYDAEGNVSYESEVGNTNAPGSGVPCTAWTYDDMGNELSVKQPDGSKALSSYDGQGNAAVTQGEATVVSEFSPWDEGTSYDASGRAVSKSDAAQSHEGLETTTTLDKLGRVTAQTAVRDGVSGQSTTTTYNDLGWVLQSVDANGVTTSMTYDAHGAVVSQTIGTKTTTRSYSATTGRLETVTTADGATLTYSYDAFGRVVREFHQQGGVTLKDFGGTNGTTLDSLGRPANQTEAVTAITHAWTYPVNAASGTQESINYDSTPLTSLTVTRNGREVETSRSATIASGVTATLATADSTSGRDTADRWKQRTIQRSGYTAKTQNRAFDAAGRLTSQSGLGFSSAGSYTYDASSGQKTAESLPLALGGTFAGSYTYYPGGSLAVATTNGTEESFTYDEVGNLVTDTVTDTGTTTFTYDSANRLTRSDHLEDTDGASAVTTYYGWDSANAWRTCQGPTPSPTQANSPIDFSYNALGRLSAYADSDANTSASYTYDATGQRTKSVVTVGSTITTTSFAYDGFTLMKLSAVQGSSSWRIDYLYDEEGALWGGVYRSPAGSTSPVYFSLITTDRGDVIELCDAEGDPFAAYRYDAWGLPQGAGSYATGIWIDTDGTNLITSTLAGQIATRQVLRYASYAWDAESALYYCSARYYDPATRQWTTGDPAKADGEESACQYCSGGPTESTDARGLDASRRFYVPRRGDATDYLRKVMKTNAGWAWTHDYDDLKAKNTPRTGDYDYKRLLKASAWHEKRWSFTTPIKRTLLHVTWRWNVGSARSPVWKTERHHAYYGKAPNGVAMKIGIEDFGNINFGFTGHAYHNGGEGWQRYLVTLPQLCAFSKGVSNADSWASRQEETRDEAMITWGWKLFGNSGWGKVDGTHYYTWRNYAR